MHGSFSMRPEEIEEMKERRAAEIAQAEKDDRDARFGQALAAVASGKLSVLQASMQYNVRRATLTAHAVAAAAGKQAPKVGRPPVMTAEQIQDIVEIVKDRDLHKDSIKDCDWPDFIVSKLEAIHGPGGGHSKKHKSSYHPDTIRSLRDKIAPEEVRKTYDQNQARYEALAELYHQIAFAIAVRIAFGYLFSKLALGREVDEEPPARNPNKLYNADTSSTFCADKLPSQAHMAEGSKAELAKRGRSAASTKSKNAPKTQRRSIQYVVVAGIQRALAAVALMKDKNWSGLRLFRSQRMPKFFLVCEGTGVSKKELAERVEFEIINKVIKEDSKRVDEEASYGEAVEMEQESERAYHISPELDADLRLPPTRGSLDMILGSDDEADQDNEKAEKMSVDGSDFDESEHVSDKEWEESRRQEEDGGEEEEGDADADSEFTYKRLKQLWREMYGRPLFFQDGERNFLVAVLALLGFDRLCFDLLKSGGSCTAFQQLLDRIKSFLQIRGFYNGREFQKILELQDKDIPKTSLISEWEHIFEPVDPASRRVFLRFLYAFPTQIDKHITELTLRKGWRDIFVYPFNQRGMFEVVPGYSKLTDEEKVELDARIPDIIAACIKEGSANASDELIYKHVGHIIGTPRRGLPGDRDAARPPRVVDLDEGVEEGDEGEEDAEAEAEQPAKKKGSSGRKERAIMPLERMFFNRWRAAYFTPETYRRALAVQAQRVADAAMAKEQKAQAAAEEKAKKAEETAAKKAVKAAAKQLKDEERALGPRIKVARSKEAVERCFECLATYTDPPVGEESPWTGCDHCDARWVCGNLACKDELERHEVKCKLKRIAQEAAHQAAVMAAPRAASVPPKASAKKEESNRNENK